MSVFTKSARFFTVISFVIRLRNPDESIPPPAFQTVDDS
jgi:hypothetical protein